MNWLKCFLLTACLALPLATTAPVRAETATPAAPAPMKADAPKAAMPAKADEDKDDEPKMSEADKRAKAIDCSKQADAKKLHGEARKKFRSACKHGK